MTHPHPSTHHHTITPQHTTTNTPPPSYDTPSQTTLSNQLLKKYICEGMWRMLQVDEPDDYVLATNETHPVREFIEKAFAFIGTTIEWQGEFGTVDEIGMTSPINLSLNLSYEPVPILSRHIWHTYQYSPSIDPTNTNAQHTPSISQTTIQSIPLFIQELNRPYQSTLSIHPITTPFQSTLSTHPHNHF